MWPGLRIPFPDVMSHRVFVQVREVRWCGQARPELRIARAILKPGHVGWAERQARGTTRTSTALMTAMSSRPGAMPN